MGIRGPIAAYHPEANGSAEAKEKALKLLLRSLVTTEFNQWDKFLPFALFASTHRKTTKQGLLPFCINHGFEANFAVQQQ